MQERVLKESVITITTEEDKVSLGRSPREGKQAGTPKRESILQWFDKSVEKELERRRTEPLSPKLNIANQSGLRHQLMTESSASAVDISAELRSEQATDLLNAVDKLARAETMVAFEGAVQAAELASSSVPPEFAEEAAVAGARGFQADITATVKEDVPGEKPIEVVGYIGITRPRRPRKS